MLINRKDENSDLRRKSEPFVLKSVPITSSCAPANQNNQNPANGNHLPMPSAPSLGYIPSQSGVVSCDADPMNSNFNHSLLPFAQWLPEKVINKEESELKDILASEEEMLELQLKSPVTVQMNQQIQSVSCRILKTSRNKISNFLMQCIPIITPWLIASRAV